MLLTGQITHYQSSILRSSGQGGMRVVYLANDMALGSRCALKENIPHLLACFTLNALARIREQVPVVALSMADLRHSRLCRSTDCHSPRPDDIDVDG